MMNSYRVRSPGTENDRGDLEEHRKLAMDGGGVQPKKTVSLQHTSTMGVLSPDGARLG